MLANAYLTLLAIHSYWRWLVLLTATASVVIAMLGLIYKLPFRPFGRRASTLYIAAIDVQLLLGVCLYLSSPIVRSAWMNISLAMKQHESRFFSVEHITTMLIGVCLAHIGSSRCKRTSGESGKHARMLLWYSASLSAILIGIPWWRPLLR